MQEPSFKNPMDRRKFLRLTSRASLTGLGALALPSLLAACSDESGGNGQAENTSSSGGKAKPSGRLVYAGFGGAYEESFTKAVLDPFTEETGIEVVVTTGAFDTALLKAQIDSNAVEWDLVDGGTTLAGPRMNLGLVEEIDYSKIDKNDFLTPDYASPYALGIYAFSHNVYWNTERAPDGMSSWKDVFDIGGAPGRRGFLDNGEWCLEQALLADGVAPEDLYPLDLDRVFEVLDAVRDDAVFLDINALATSIAQQDVITGDLALQRTRQLIADGVPLDYSWKHALVDIDRLMIPKGAPNRENAQLLLEFIVQPEQQLALHEVLGNSPATTSGFDQLPEDAWADMAASPVTTPDAVFLDIDWWAENGTEAKERFQEWLLG